MVCTSWSHHVQTNFKFQWWPSRKRDKMKQILFLDSSEGVFDAFRDCSDNADITAFSTMRKSV